MVWRKPPFTDNEQRNWDLLGDVAEGGGSGGGGAFYVAITGEGDNLSIDKTSAEILSAIKNNSVLIFTVDDMSFYPVSIYAEGDIWSIRISDVFLTRYSAGVRVMLEQHEYDIYDEGDGIVIENNSIGEVSVPLDRVG